MTKTEIAAKKHEEGYNCAQSVLCAFCEETGLDEKTALNLAEGFGGGIGGMHSVCGAVTGMIMAANLILGKAEPKNPRATKQASYCRTKQMAEDFLKMNSSIICSEIKGDEATPPLRSCEGCIEDAVKILESYLDK